MSKRHFDVIVLGSGIGGSELACVLAKNGVDVLIVDAAKHPRFAIGESTTPQYSQLVSLMAREHDIPELELIGLQSPAGIAENISTNCGVKRITGFVHHVPGKNHDPKQALIFGNVWREENHFFRQDIDQYVMCAAVKYGATVLENTRVDSIEITDTGVRVESSAGEFTAEYVADGSGHRSLLAEQMNLRETPPRFQHHSRSLFTHMTGVTPFEDCEKTLMSVPWSRGTLHHVFERGWIWVIPFNNWEGATNPLVSVGLQLDPRFYPERSDLSPEEEFFELIARYPSVQKQFAQAKSVRPWVRTNRLQYSSRKCVGHRWCLLSHAAGFIDPLYSRGLINTLEVNRQLARALIEAKNTGDYSFDRFSHIEGFQRKVLDYADRLANASLITWGHFDLWNAWIRVWLIGAGSAESALAGQLLAFGFPSFRRPLLKDFIFSPFEDPGYAAFFERMERIVLAFERGEHSAPEALALMNRELENYDFTMNLPNGSDSHRWAMRNLGCRDIYLGKKELHARWENRISDPMASFGPA